MVLDSGATTMMQQYATSVLTTLQRQIEGVVHQSGTSDTKRRPGCRGATLKLELVYRASRDGWCATDFHSKCDNNGATVTVIKSTGGYVLGGYADLPWA